MSSWPTTDLALAVDTTRFRADLVIAGGDLALADTPVTPLLVALGSDRRAEADDELPGGRSATTVPVSWSERRGWWGDALDRAGRRCGSRLWLLDREKASEEVRGRAEAYVREALAFMTVDYGIEPEIDVTLARLDTPSPALFVRVRVDGRSVSVARRLA